MSVPLMLQYMKMVPGIDKLDLSALKHMICGGSPVPQSLIFAFRKMSIDVFHVYGATEYTGAISFWTHAMGVAKSNSMGKIVIHGALKILSPEDDRELPVGEVGEIFLLGPQVFKGYWNNDDATGAALKNGGYRSGDLGKMDEDGFVYVIDRLKDMIISGGENIYPAEIEDVIVAHPAVAEVAVVGRPDETWGEAPVAVVVKKPGIEVATSDIIALCREKLAGFKCVKDVVFVDAIPKNAVGKVLKQNLKKRIGG
jgi:fatty-acyl-CoA synthase